MQTTKLEYKSFSIFPRFHLFDNFVHVIKVNHNFIYTYIQRFEKIINYQLSISAIF